MTPLNSLERLFVNRYQGGFPLIKRPFLAVAKQLGCDESTLLDIVKKLREKRIITRFGPLYDAVQMGGGLTLAALSVAEKDYHRITEVVNGFSQVAHNYRREHELNMWFVLATENPREIDFTIAQIENQTGLKVFNFPKQKEFYIGLWLNIDGNGEVITAPLPENIVACGRSEYYKMDALDRQIITQTQSGLALDREPYQHIASQIGSTVYEVISRLGKMRANGIIRRIGAVPNHYLLGLKANGMTVWDVPDDQAQALGAVVGQLDFVSHCYLRPRHLPGWRYNLFAMVHAQSRDEVESKYHQIKAMLGRHCKAHDILFSAEILKKTGLRLAA